MNHEEISTFVPRINYKEVADEEWCSNFIAKDPSFIEKCWMATNEFLHKRYGYPNSESPDVLTGQEIANLFYIYDN